MYLPRSIVKWCPSVTVLGVRLTVSSINQEPNYIQVTIPEEKKETEITKHADKRK